MGSLGSDAKGEEFEKKAIQAASKIFWAMYRRTKRGAGKDHGEYRTAILKQHIQALAAGEQEAGPEPVKADCS